MTAQGSNITSLLSPNSVAITGVSDNPEDLGSYILRNIIMSGFKGRIFPVTSKVSQLFDFDTYGSIRDVKEEIDLAVLASPSDRVIDDVYDCTRSKVKNICIASRGFAEVGVNGLTLQKKMRRMANEAGIRILGPNSLGIVSTEKDLNATFGQEIPAKGRAVFLSQSGALMNSLIEYAKSYSFGLSDIIGLGNKSDLNEIDFFEYYSSLRKDGQPTVLGCYLENIANGKEFLDAAQHLAKDIPLVSLIPSESPKTREYIYSHTGNILQRDAVIDIALEQSGGIKVYTQQQLFDLMLTFSWQVLPRGSNVAIVSNAGGGLILAIEQLYRLGLNLVNFSTEVKKMLTSELDWKSSNPGVVDLGGEAKSLKYLKALDIVLGDHDVNSVVIILSPQVMTEVEESAEVVGRLAKEHGKTIIAAFMGYDEVELGIKALSKYFIPAFNSVDRAIFVLAKMYEYFKRTQHDGGITTKFSRGRGLDKTVSNKLLGIIERARIDKELELKFHDCYKLLKNYEIDFTQIKQVGTLKDLKKFGEKQGYPIEFVCPDKKANKIITKKEDVKSIFEKHFKKYKENDKHKFEDHVAKKVYKGKRRFKIAIAKDSYYEERDKGFSISELEDLSFGYYFEFKVEGVRSLDSMKSLIPLQRDKVDEYVSSLSVSKYFGYRPGVKAQKFREQLLKFILKVNQIPQDFPQILDLELVCVVDREKIKVVDCKIGLDLVTS